VTSARDGTLLAELDLAATESSSRTTLHTWLRDPLDGCTPGAIREAATVLGELVSNAVSHAAPPYRVRLTTSRRGHLIRLAVADSTPGDSDPWPVGRGLRIVRGLCPRWGVQVDGADGKTVWAELTVMVPPAAAEH
jgi:two-component sensor histidine kinase